MKRIEKNKKRSLVKISWLRNIFFTLNKEKKLKVLLSLQVLNKNQTLLIKMDTVHNNIIDHFEFVQKGKQKLRNRLFFWKKIRNG